MLNVLTTKKGSLRKHIKTIHEGVKFPCEQCDYKATQKGDLLRHIKSKHQGVKFNLCTWGWLPLVLRAASPFHKKLL